MRAIYKDIDASEMMPVNVKSEENNSTIPIGN